MNAQKDQAVITNENLERKGEYIAELKKRRDSDADRSGDVTLRELMSHLDDPGVQVFADTLDMGILDVNQSS